MNFLKYIVTMSLIILLSGCAGIWAGVYSESVATNPKTGDVLINPLTRQPIKLKTRKARSVAVADAGADMVASITKKTSQSKRVKSLSAARSLLRR